MNQRFVHRLLLVMLLAAVSAGASASTVRTEKGDLVTGDAEAFAQALEEIGPGGEVLVWLKETGTPRPSAELARRVAVAEAEAGGSGPISRLVLAFELQLAEQRPDLQIEQQFELELTLTGNVAVDLRRIAATTEPNPRSVRASTPFPSTDTSVFRCAPTTRRAPRSRSPRGPSTARSTASCTVRCSRRSPTRRPSTRSCPDLLPTSG